MCAFKDDVMSVTVQGAEIIAGSVDGTVRRFDIRRGRVYTDDLHHPVTHVAVSHDQLCVLAACLDSQLRLLDKGTGELLATYTGHQHESVKMECAITPSDAYVIGSSEDGELYNMVIAHTPAAELIILMLPDCHAVASVALPQPRRLALHLAGCFASWLTYVCCGCQSCGASVHLLHRGLAVWWHLRPVLW